MSIDCAQCGECCKIMIFTVKADYPEAKEFYEARGFEVEGDYVRIILPHQCPHLTINNKCDIHQTKPLVCKQFPHTKFGEIDFNLLPKRCIWNKREVYVH